jgi:transcriptional regulator GlxA family with amidase domain
MRIGIVVFDGFDEIDAIGPYEVFRNAGIETLLVTQGRNKRGQTPFVTGSHGLRVEVQGALEDSFDLVLVPGGGWNDRAETGAWGEAQRGELPAELQRLHGSGTRIAGVCTGGMLLSAAGLTRGRPATTHAGALDQLREQGAEVIEERVVDDGDILTAGGVTSGFDLALWIVESELGREVADTVAREMEYERTGAVWSAQTGAE